MSDLTAEEMENWELSEAYRYGHTGTICDINARQMKRLKKRLELAIEALNKIAEPKFGTEVHTPEQQIEYWAEACRVERQTARYALLEIGDVK